MAEPSHTVADILRVELSPHHLGDEGIRVCGTGGRDFTDRKFVWSKLDAFHTENVIREFGIGCALGVDASVLAWAEANDIPWQRYVADWDRWGTAGGSIRNIAMLEDFQPEVLLVFPGGVGTTHCARAARKRKIAREFFEVLSDDPFAEAIRWG